MMKERLNLKTNSFGNISRFATSCYRPNIYYDVIHDNTNGQSYVHLKKFIKKCLEEGNKNKPVNIFYFYKKLPLITCLHFFSLVNLVE